jgi:Ser/Thr protein kinase RdoA (MazF antagonist)
MDLIERLRAALPIDSIESLSGGHQSRVFSAVGPSGRLVVKVQDASLVDRTELLARLDVVAALAELHARVCRPLSVGDTRVVELRSDGQVEHYVTCFDFAPGTAPDPERPTDAEQMGTALAHLHRSMRQLPPVPLPAVAALRTPAAEELASTVDRQLLHGDFNAGNLRLDAGAVNIFDFDDCGYGPPAFDVANALYMVAFDGYVSERSEVYDRFRTSFVHGYVDGSPASLDGETIDRLIDLRVDALSAWLDDLDHAPADIKNASSTWLATLRGFVVDHHRRSGR